MPSEPHDDLPPEIQGYSLGRGAALALVAATLLLCSLPPLWRNLAEAFSPTSSPAAAALISPPGHGSTLRQHLRAAESEIEDAPFTAAPRRVVQSALTASLNSGNRKVTPGRDGWLFYRPALDALTGFGPLQPEPTGVASDPGRGGWTPPLPVILDFAQQLEARGVDLLIVPIPVKPMIYPDQLANGLNFPIPLHHPDQPELYRLLQEAGVSVLDLAPLFAAAREEGQQVFLKQDTHWHPDTMRLAANAIADFVRSLDWFPSLPAAGLSTSLEESTGHLLGDLVDQLELASPLSFFSPEGAQLHRVIDSSTGRPVAADPASPIALLGDSFVNIFHDPGLGFSDASPPSEDPTRPAPLLGAGLTQHLMHQLGRRIDVVAQNGGGASQVRQAFVGGRGDQGVRSKKLVIWALASRDLLLSQTPAAEAGVSWAFTAWPDGELAAGEALPFRALARLDQPSRRQDPTVETYPHALHVASYQVVTALDLDPSTLPARPDALPWPAPHPLLPDSFLAVQPTFVARQWHPLARTLPGQELELTLVPWEPMREAPLPGADTSARYGGENLSDDFSRFDVPYYLVVDAARPGGEPLVDGAPSHPLPPALVALAASLLLAAITCVGIVRREKLDLADNISSPT